MKIKLQYIVKPFNFKEGQKIEFIFNKVSTPIYIEMRRLAPEELKEKYKSGDILCTTISEMNVSESDLETLKATPSIISDSFKKNIDEIENKLYKYTKITINNFRWVLGGVEPQVPIRFSLPPEWSENGNQWKKLPQEYGFGDLMIGFITESNISDEKIATIADLVEKQVSEPLSYELLSEAWNQKGVNPRSALVIGVAAAETGFKEFVSKLIPDAEWLLTNIQSPPLVRMLKDFLPKIPTKLKIKGKVLPPPKEILKTIDSGVQLRNKIVHSKSDRLNESQVHEILKAIYDLLYILDYYSGHKWAEKNISYETRASLTK